MSSQTFRMREWSLQNVMYTCMESRQIHEHVLSSEVHGFHAPGQSLLGQKANSLLRSTCSCRYMRSLFHLSRPSLLKNHSLLPKSLRCHNIAHGVSQRMHVSRCHFCSIWTAWVAPSSKDQPSFSDHKRIRRRPLNHSQYYNPSRIVNQPVRIPPHYADAAHRILPQATIQYSDYNFLKGRKLDSDLRIKRNFLWI